MRTAQSVNTELGSCLWLWVLLL